MARLVPPSSEIVPIRFAGLIPVIDDEAISDLNRLFNSKQKLEEFYYSCKNYLDNRMLS